MSQSASTDFVQLSHLADKRRQIQAAAGRLRRVWWVWLGYRLLGLPVLLSLLHPSHPDLLGGIVWQGLWLLPALILTPWLHQGKSPYALLLGSMLTLVYFGASGVVLFMRVYDMPMGLLWLYAFDVLLLLLINIWLFKLLKKLPSMNKSMNNSV